MKMKHLIFVGAGALLSALVLPATYAQEGGPRLQDGSGEFHRRPHDGPRHDGPRGRGPRGTGDPEILIERLDTSGDGLVDFDEFLDERLARVDTHFERRDADDDGQLSEEEAARPRRRGREPEATDRELVLECVRETVADWEGPFEVEDRFDNIDLDGDGYISLAELSTSLEVRARVLFDRIDADGDGLISLEEVEAHLEEQINLRRIIRACKQEVTDPFEASL